MNTEKQSDGAIHFDVNPYIYEQGNTIAVQADTIAALAEVAQSQTSMIERLTAPRPSMVESLPALMPLIVHMIDLLKPAPRPEMGPAERRVMIDSEAAHAKLMIELEEARTKARAVDQLQRVASMSDDDANDAA